MPLNETPPHENFLRTPLIRTGLPTCFHQKKPDWLTKKSQT